MMKFWYMVCASFERGKIPYSVWIPEPFTYLWLPQGTYRPSFQEFSPLLSKIETKLNWISKMLSYQGRLVLVNSVFTAMPTFYMCSLILPSQVIKQLTGIGNIVCGVKVISTKKVPIWQAGSLLVGPKPSVALA